MTGRALAPEGIDALAWPESGLLPAVVQDVSDDRVLMLAWMDRDALAATFTHGEVHFHSRSRGRLWRKGETSGNILRLIGVAYDCDADALLVTASPTGPTCHTGARSCFDAGSDRMPAPAMGEAGFAWLDQLWTTIDARATERPEGSYTARLLAGGVDAPARKVAEEAVEVLMAAKDDAVASRGAPEPSARGVTRTALAGEAADLLYHLLVLLRERDLAPAEVLAILRGRHEQ